MPAVLPDHPNADAFKRRAKKLLAAARRGEPEARERILSRFPGLEPGDMKLAQAQTALAREHGFPSFTAALAAMPRTRPRHPKPRTAKERAEDARRLAARWFDIAEAGDIASLAVAMQVAKRRLDAARAVMKEDAARYRGFVAALLTGLDHPVARLRFECAHALDSFGDVSCVPALAKLMDDPVPKVRWMAMHALTCHACSEETCVDDPELHRRIAQHALADESIQVRRHAAYALGQTRTPFAAEVLSGMLGKESDPALLRAVRWALSVAQAPAKPA